MPSILKKAMLFLGLGSDEDFEALDREVVGDPYDIADRVRPTDEAPGAFSAPMPPHPGMVPVQPASSRPMMAPRPDRRGVASSVRPLPADEVSVVKPVSVVRTVPAPRGGKPHVVSPVSFNDAQEVADHFKRTQPVIVNLQQADRDLTRRLIDFASGLCYGVGGSMKKVADAVYLLTPADVEVSAEERERLQDAGLYDR